MSGLCQGSLVQQTHTGAHTALALDRSQALALHLGDLGLQVGPRQGGRGGVGGPWYRGSGLDEQGGGGQGLGQLGGQRLQVSTKRT